MAGREAVKKRVLVVDDEERILRFISVKLKVCGYDVVTATRGQEALDLVQSAKPDIMLLDILMPGIDGFEVLRRLRAFTGLPVIVLTAKSGTSDQAVSLGANDYLAKPFNPDELVTRIRALLERQR